MGVNNATIRLNARCLLFTWKETTMDHLLTLLSLVLLLDVKLKISVVGSHVIVELNETV